MSRQKRDKSSATTTSDRNHPEKPKVRLTEEQLEAIAGGGLPNN